MHTRYMPILVARIAPMYSTTPGRKSPEHQFDTYGVLHHPGWGEPNIKWDRDAVSRGQKIGDAILSVIDYFAELERKHERQELEIRSVLKWRRFSGNRAGYMFFAEITGH